jgi:HAD superfamily hydrolase (TIGR01549 family)
VTAVVFDVGETLVDETGAWERAADAAGVPRFTLMAMVGAAIVRGESHRCAFEWLGVEGAEGGAFTSDEFYPDALGCLQGLRRHGIIVGAVGNLQAANEDFIRGQVDFVGSSERWGVEKPSSDFFARVVYEAGREPAEIAYVGDRVDNDVEPALAAGMVAVHLRRGPWAYLQEAPPEAIRIRSLGELPGALP